MPQIALNNSSLYNGVSQQNPELRLDSQATDIENASLSVSRGFEKRNGAEAVHFSDTETYTQNMATHGFRGSDGVNYMILVNEPGEGEVDVSFSVLDTEGNEYVLTGTDEAKAYMNAQTPSEALRMVTIRDSVFVTNKGVKVSLDPLSAFSGADGDTVNELYSGFEVADWTLNLEVGDPVSFLDVGGSFVSTFLANAFPTSYIEFDPSISADQDGMNLTLSGTTGVGSLAPVYVVYDGVEDVTPTIIEDLGGGEISIPITNNGATSVKFRFRSDLGDSPSMYLNVIQITSEEPASDTGTAYLWIKNGVQQVERTVSFWNASTADWVSGVQADNNTKDLVEAFVAHVTGEPGSSVSEEISFSVAKLVEPTATSSDNLMTATDSYGDTTMQVCHIRSSSIEDLPPIASNNEVVKIVGDADSDATYHLQYSSEEGTWYECPGLGVKTGLLSSTMPHRIDRKIATDNSIPGVLTGEVYFEIATIDYAPRTVGDLDSAPNPSFVGEAISDVFFYKNRLGFVTRDSIICSATDDIYNFYPKTVKEVFDDDPIDLTVSTNESVVLSFASIFPDSMVISGDTVQYNLHSDGKPFTVSNATLDIMTKYQASENLRPASTGSSLFLGLPINDYTSFREFLVSTDTLITEGHSITDHVSSYVPNSVKTVLAENNLESLFVFAKGDPKSLYVYNWLKQGNEKVQSSWSKWTFSFDIMDIISFDNYLYVVATENLRDEGEITNHKVDALYKINVEKTTPTVDVFANHTPLMDNISLVNNTNVYYDGTETVINVDELTYYNMTKDGLGASLVDRITGVGYVITGFGNFSDLGFSVPGYYIWSDMPPFSGTELPVDIIKP